MFNSDEVMAVRALTDDVIQAQPKVIEGILLRYERYKRMMKAKDLMGVFFKVSPYKILHN